MMIKYGRIWGRTVVEAGGERVFGGDETVTGPLYGPLLAKPTPLGALGVSGVSGVMGPRRRGPN